MAWTNVHEPVPGSDEVEFLVGGDLVGRESERCVAEDAREGLSELRLRADAGQHTAVARRLLEVVERDGPRQRVVFPDRELRVVQVECRGLIRRAVADE